MSDFQLAVCSEMVFTELPIIDRVRRIDDLGFAVEIWSWHDKDLDALAATGARFSSMTGYLHGDLIDPDSADEVVRTAELRIKAAETLGVPRLDPASPPSWSTARPPGRGTAPPGEMWLTALRAWSSRRTRGRAGVTFCVENLNTIVDHPGVPLARAKDTLALVEGVGHPNVKMMLDLYHAQIGEGNLYRARPPCRQLHRRDPGRRRARAAVNQDRRDPLSRRREGARASRLHKARSAWRPRLAATASRLLKRSAPRSPSDNPVGQYRMSLASSGGYTVEVSPSTVVPANCSIARVAPFTSAG